MSRLLRFSLALAVGITAHADLLRDTSGGRAVAAPQLRPVQFVGIPKVASNESAYFAAWGDYRYANADVFGARIGANGAPIDPAGLPIHATWQSDSIVRTVWNGSEYVVFAATELLGSWAIRIDPTSGERRGLQLATAPPNDAVWTGAGYATIRLKTEASTAEGGRQMTLSMLDPSFNITSTHTLGDPSESAFRTWLSSDGEGNVLVVWSTFRESTTTIYAQAFANDGRARGERARIAQKDPYISGVYYGLEPATIWNGTNYTIVWTENGIRGRNLTRDGVPSEPFTISDEVLAQLPSIGWNGRLHLVTWHVATSTPLQFLQRAVLMASNGVVLTPVEIGALAARYTTTASIASNGDTFFVHWYGANYLVRSAGTPRVEQLPDITAAFRNQTRPKIAASSSKLFVAWIEGETLYAARLSRTGEPLDGPGIAVATHSAIGDFRLLQVAATDRTFLVAWTELDGHVRIARITDDGLLLDPSGVVVGSGWESLAVAAGDGEFRLVWVTLSPSGTPAVRQLVTTTVPERGPVNVSSPSTLVPSPGLSLLANKLFWAENEWLLVWQQFLAPPCGARLCPPSPWQISVMRLDREGTATNSRPFLQPAEYPAYFDVEWNGEELLVLFSDRTTVRTQRVSRQGDRIGDSQFVATLDRIPFAVELAPTLNGWLAIYESYENINTYGTWHTIERAVPLAETGVATGLAVEIFPREDAVRIGGTIFAFGATWTNYVARWRALPDAHEGGVDRVYVRALHPRRRVTAR